MSKPRQNLELKEGLYQVIYGDRYVVQVLKTLQGQFPCTKEILMAHFMSGAPRFPMPVQALITAGAQLHPL